MYEIKTIIVRNANITKCVSILKYWSKYTEYDNRASIVVWWSKLLDEVNAVTAVEISHIFVVHGWRLSDMLTQNPTKSSRTSIRLISSTRSRFLLVSCKQNVHYNVERVTFFHSFGSEYTLEYTYGICWQYWFFVLSVLHLCFNCHKNDVFRPAVSEFQFGSPDMAGFH